MAPTRTRKGRSFRATLAWSCVALVAIVAIPVLCLEVQRPWRELETRIDRAEALLSGVHAGLDAQAIDRMSAFALHVVDTLHADGPATNLPEWAPGQAFSLLVSEGRLPSEQEARKVLADNDADSGQLDYDELAHWYHYWEGEMDARPGLLDDFRRAKRLLRDARVDAEASGFEVADVYVMVDAPGSRRRLFEHDAALLVDSLGWWEGTYPGEPYDLVETDTAYWRASYDRHQGGTPGFHHNPVSDRERWYLPRFDNDKWGASFSSWLATERSVEDERLVETFNVDFNADRVRHLMLGIAATVAAVAVALGLVILLVVRRLGNTLARPIEALTAGAEAVMARRYDHVVPPSDQAEFARLIDVFNKMTVDVGQTVNLKETLTKLLSEELADLAGRDGLVLGGREVDTTIMFTDFAGFSTLTRKMSPEEVVRLLNLYFGELIPIIKKHGGFPDKFIGDAIVAIFGAPVALPDNAARGVRCAIEMQRRLRTINDERLERGESVFEMRVGLNSGSVVVGAIGCDLKLEYTAIGETANMANRMESQCPIGQVLMAANTHALIAGSSFDGALIEATPRQVIVKGYGEAVGAHAAWVNDLDITTNPDAANPAEFYVHERGVERG